MSKNKEKELLIDLAGFIKWSLDNNKESGGILSNLTHDICSFLKETEGFSPRTAGYAKYWN